MHINKMAAIMLPSLFPVSLLFGSNLRNVEVIKLLVNIFSVVMDSLS